MPGQFWRNVAISAGVLGLLGSLAGGIINYQRHGPQVVDLMTKPDNGGYDFYYSLWGDTTDFLKEHPYSQEQATADTEKLRLHLVETREDLQRIYPGSSFSESPMSVQDAEALSELVKKAVIDELGSQQWYDSCVSLEYGTEHAERVLNPRDSFGTIEEITPDGLSNIFTSPCKDGGWNVLLREQPSRMVWMDMPHEFYHARRWLVTLPEKRYDDRLEETEASLFSWEILARLALGGSLEADYALSNLLWVGADYYIRDPLVPDWDAQLSRGGAYFVLPYRGVIEMLHEGRIKVTDYLGIYHGDFTLDSLEEYLKTKVGMK